jgi:hypothetical protein
MVAGHTRTGENIKCSTQTITGTEIQKGSLIKTNGGVNINSMINRWWNVTKE